MDSSEVSPIRFRIIAQERGNMLVVEHIDEKVYFYRNALEIMNDQQILQGFSVQEAALIGFIAGSSL